MTSPSANHINNQRFVLRLDKQPLTDTKVVELCLQVAVCPAGGRSAGAKQTQEERHTFDLVFVVGSKDDVVAVVVVVVLSALKMRTKALL